MEVQVFGVRKSADTRKALRFFAERRIRTHFVDVQERPPSPGELRRFSDRFGIGALVDRDSRRLNELGLAHSVHPDSWWFDQLTVEPLMLRMPLVRFGKQLTVGLSEAAWRAWVDGA